VKLYEITDALLQVEDLLEAGEDVQDTIDALQLSLEDKIEGLAKVIRNFEASAEAKKNEAKRLKEQAEKDQANADRLKDWIKFNLIMLGKKKVETDLFKITVTKPREKVEVDETRLPDDYFIIKREPISKTELKKLVKEQEIPGVQIVLGEPGLMIK
jgi:hypothetical protein